MELHDVAPLHLAARLDRLMAAAAAETRLSAAGVVLLVIAAGTIVRIGLAAATGLGYDESYMVGNARQLMAGYVDHPPLHVWIAWAAAHLLGSEAPLAVRLPFILLFAGSTWLMFRLTARIFDERAGLWAAIAFNLAPVFSLADATWVLPDGPLIFFLLAAAIVVARILFASDARSMTLLWIAAGLLGGLALLSKFSAAFFFPGVLAYLVSVPSARRHLASAGPWLGVAVALAVLSPALIWNFQNDWIGIAFQSGRLAAPRFRLDGILLGFGAQLLYLTPWLAVPFLLSLWSALRAGRADLRGWYLALLATGPIVVFSLMALFTRTLPHWAMPGWLFAIALFGRDAALLAASRPRFPRGYMMAAGIVFAVLIGAFTLQATRGGLVPDSVIAANPAADPTTDLIDWSALRSALEERGLIGPDLVVAAPSWLAAGKASYALGPDVPVLCLCREAQQFAFRTDQGSFAGRDVIVVTQPGRLRSQVVRYFDTLLPMPPVVVSRAGKPVFSLDVILGRNLQFP